MLQSSRAALAAVCLTAALSLPGARADPPETAGAPGDPLPPGAVARLGSVRLRHVAAALAWAPDGKTFASVGGDGALHVWNADDGAEVHQFRTTQSASLNSVLYLPDGKGLIASGSDGCIHVWDPATGLEVRTLGGWPGQPIARLARCPDEGAVAAFGYDNTCRVVDLTTGKVVRQLEGVPGARLTYAVLSPDGRRMAGWSAVPPGDPFTVWDAADGKELFHAPTSLKSVTGLVFSPDGKTLAVFTHFPQPQLVTWDVDTGKELRRYDDLGSMDYPVFSPNGKYLAGRGVDRAVHLWGLASGKDLRQFDLAPWNMGGFLGPGALAFSPDGKRLAVCLGSAIRVWDVATAQELHEFTGHYGAVDDVRFTPDGRRLLSCGKDNTARLWDAVSGRQLASWTGNPTLASEPAASSDGRYVVAAAGMNVVRAELAEGKTTEKPLLALAAGGSLNALTLSQDGKKLAAYGSNRLLHLWDVATGQDLWQPSGDASGFNHVLAFSPDGRLLADGAVNAPVRLWDVAANKEARQLDAANAPAAVAPAAVAPVLPRPRIPAGVSAQFHAATYLAFTPDGKGLLCVANSELSLWEVGTGRDRLRIYRPGGGLFTSVAFSPAGDLLAAGTTAGVVLVLDAANGNELAERQGPRGVGVTSLAFAPDGKTLASGEADGAVLIWDVKEWAGRPPAAVDLQPEKLPTLWKDLIDGDAGRAYKAVLTLAAAPRTSVPFLKERLAGVEGGDDKRIARLVQDLNDDQFDVREKAQKDLEQLGELALPALRKAVESNPPAETRRRAQELLDRRQAAAAVTEEVRGLRALEALERAGAAEALRDLAKTAPNALVKQEAGEALDRLARRGAAP